MGIQITPSILNADFARLGEEVARIPSADWVHVDVMDNHFVPNLTFGPTMVEALVRSTDVPLDAHLMIEDADRNALAYVEAGCGSVTFHVEAARAPVRLAREIRAHGARASMALRPATPIDATLGTPDINTNARGCVTQTGALGALILMVVLSTLIFVYIGQSDSSESGIMALAACVTLGPLLIVTIGLYIFARSRDERLELLAEEAAEAQARRADESDGG